MGDTSVRRVLGAVRLMDQATGLPVTAPLRVQAPGAVWIQNRSGWWVLARLEGLEEHAIEYLAPPSAPAARSITVTTTVEDPAGNWLPRVFTLKVPRPVGTGPNDLFTPQDVALAPAPNARLRQAWAAVRATVQFAKDSDHPEFVPIEGAVVRLVVSGAGGAVRCLSLTNDLGQGLAIGTGIQMFEAGDDDEAIIAPAQNHDIVVVVDPVATDPETGRRTSVPDPDDIWTRRASLRRSFKNAQPLAPGDERHFEFTIPRS